MDCPFNSFERSIPCELTFSVSRSIGKQRELKQALEAFWKGDLAAEALAETCTALKKRHWRIQQDAGLDYVTTGDFSLYDRMLDITRMLGAMPPRFAPCLKDAHPDLYFSMARGRCAAQHPGLGNDQVV